MPGKRQVFSDRENEVLRAALRRLRDEKELTQKELGELLGMRQQNAGRLVGAAKTGMSRDAANRLARRLGYRDAEHYLLEVGVFSGLEQPPAGSHWRDRDTAVNIARKLGYAEEAIQAVIKRFGAHDYSAKVVRWWVDQIVLESLALASERSTELPIPDGPKRPTAKRAG